MCRPRCCVGSPEGKDCPRSWVGVSHDERHEQRARSWGRDMALDRISGRSCLLMMNGTLGLKAQRTGRNLRVARKD